jgi:cell division protein FtsB
VSKGTTTVDRPTEPPRSADSGRSRLGDLSRPIQIDRRIAKNRRSNFLLAIVALGIAGALAAALFVLPVQTYFGQEERLDQRQVQLEQLQTVNNDLRAEVERLGTDAGVREAAREELGFVESGERRLSILDLPAVPTDLPDGWPYSIITNIVALRSAIPAPAPTSSEVPDSTP